MEESLKNYGFNIELLQKSPEKAKISPGVTEAEEKDRRNEKKRFLGELLQKFNKMQKAYDENSKEICSLMRQSLENDANFIVIMKEQRNVLKSLLNK